MSGEPLKGYLELGLSEPVNSRFCSRDFVFIVIRKVVDVVDRLPQLFLDLRVVQRSVRRNQVELRKWFDQVAVEEPTVRRHALMTGADIFRRMGVGLTRCQLTGLCRVTIKSSVLLSSEPL